MHTVRLELRALNSSESFTISLFKFIIALDWMSKNGHPCSSIAKIEAKIQAGLVGQKAAEIKSQLSSRANRLFFKFNSVTNVFTKLFNYRQNTHITFCFDKKKQSGTIKIKDELKNTIFYILKIRN